LPSLLDHLATPGGDDPPAPPPDGVLDSVKAEGGRRRANRHRRNAGLALLALALMVIPAATLRPGGGHGREVAVATDGGGTTPDTAEITVPTSADVAPGDPVVSEPPTLPPAAVTAAPSTSAPPASVAPATTAPPRPAPTTTPTTARVCRNSQDPACGPFRWDPALAPDKPLIADFTAAPATAVAGQPVVFEVAWSDADAKLSSDRFSTDGTSIGTSCTLAPRYGPWTPPAPSGGSGTLRYPTTFPNPGTYKVAVELGTGGLDGATSPDCTPPYGDFVRIERTITVGPAAPAG
jgi:hypothetical protein